jgi:UDP-N-acetyl-2-amino-2-deoxyglucuronate dehydrogenase
VINPWNLDALQELEAEFGRRIYTVLQLRVHPKLVELKEQLKRDGGRTHDVCLTYVTARGAWYQVSWKGEPAKSGGIATNIGVHFFDLLLWLFGDVKVCQVHHSNTQRMAGFLELEHARVKWFLSVSPADLPFQVAPGRKSTFRSITIDGRELEFTEGFTDLHTRVYEDILEGRGFGINEARPSITLVHAIRTAPVCAAADDTAHPFLNRIPTTGRGASAHA